MSKKKRSWLGLFALSCIEFRQCAYLESIQQVVQTAQSYTLGCGNKTEDNLPSMSYLLPR